VAHHADRGFTIEPAIVGDRGDPHWLIRIGDVESGMAPRTWALMAQRVAHGLKNPLTSMLLTLRRLEMEYRERAPAVAGRLDRYSGRIEARIEELRRLTSNFLKFVNVEAPRLELADVNVLVREYGSNLERTLPPDIRLDVRLGARMPHVRLDAEQVLAALDNLIANAVDAMPDGGLISLSTDVANGVQWSPTDAPGDHVTIEVADTGTGIPDELKGRLFEPGWSGREDGSGLGLAIARKVMLDHGGRITYESEVGSGTSFTLFLPIARADVVPERMAVAGTGRDGRA
jgi:signal transduction histidine kinase